MILVFGGQAIAGREGDEQVAAGVAARSAGTGEAQARSLGQALQLVGEQGGVGRDDDDDRAGAGRRVRGRLADPVRARDLVDADLGTDRHAVHAEPSALAVVGLDQDADRVTATVGRHHPRRRPDPALELVADHPRPATDVALRDRSAGRGVERRAEVLGAHVEAVDVVEQAVVRLADDGQ